MQHRWFLSYHSPDFALAGRLKASIERKDPASRVFFAPTHMRAGGFWSAQLAQEIAEATAFILLVGESGLGNWQVLEYDEALDRRVECPDFPVIFVLLSGQTAPGLPFLRRLHWIISPDPASERDIARLFDAVSGGSTRPGELWRYTSPYRGLAAMDEKDSDYFFGRGQEITETLKVLAATPNKLPVLLGNSGVGKSSLAQAGVIASLRRQAWPESIAADAWPDTLDDSRRWCFLTLRPGTEPVRSVVELFLDTWQLDRTSTEWPRRRAEWVDKLLTRALTLRDLIDQTERRYAELRHPTPTSFCIYIDQGEELYVRAERTHRVRFSQLIAQSLTDERVRVLASLRADFFGEFQKDEPLYNVHRLVNVPPLREKDLHEIVSRPAEILSARFEDDHLPAALARRTAEESSEDVGALPLLSYLLDDMWRRMVEVGDGLLRLPAQSIDLGAVLADRANAFISSHSNSEEVLRRIFTLKLVTVREDGEPTRRRAQRPEFSQEEWLLVSELAGHPNRLLVTVSREASMSPVVAGANAPETEAMPIVDETYAEVAHEAIFRRWAKLREWISAERGFLSWRNGLEFARRNWQAAPKPSKNEALLMGFALRQALEWMSERSADILSIDREFIRLSRKSMRLRKLRLYTLAGALAVVVITGPMAWWYAKWLKEQAYWVRHVHTLSSQRERLLQPKERFNECDDCPEMVVIPAGSFTMGSEVNPDEKPPHDVTIARPFAVARFELTFAEWDACAEYGDCAAGISAGGWGRGRQPAINVSWEEAQQYIAWIRAITGKPYRLLTEAEWEYAARANNPGYFSFGNDDAILSQFAWSAADTERQPHPVGEKKPNSFNLYDMHGNVSEWVEDCYHESYLNASPEGKAWTSSNCDRRVIRGGSWLQRARMLRSASRSWSNFDKGRDEIGIRVGRDLIP